MACDRLPPRPVTEFDFNLPQGIDVDDDAPNDCQNGYDSLDDLFNSPEPSEDHNCHDQNDDQQNLNYNTFEEGFSDDEGSGETFDHFWATHQAGSNPSKSKKSPRRLSTDDADDDESPIVKKPRQSLFGGPAQDIGEEEPDEIPTDYQSNFDSLNTAGQDIRNRISSLSIGEEDGVDQPFNLGFGLEAFDKGSMSPPASPALSEGSFIIPPDGQIPYELRQNIDRKKTTTYMDNDQTGNYDPQQEAKQKMLALNKAKAVKKSKKKGKGRAPKLRIRKCIAKLHFKAFGNVRNLTNEEDNWPDNWSDVDSEHEREIQKLRAFRRQNTPGLQQQVPVEDPAGELDDLTGHPAARGCVSCRHNDQTCSMSEDGPYPCYHCISDGINCEPILPPIVKGPCKRCCDDGQESCSFEDDPSQALCDYCDENKFICEALPPNGYRATRVSLNAVLYGPDRPHVACTSCCQQKKKCSLKKKEHKPPCKQCSKDGIGCTFYDLPRQDKVKKAGCKAKTGTNEIVLEASIPGSQHFTSEDLADLMEQNEEMPSREPTPEIEMEDNDGHKGMLTKIKTSFAHPIIFRAKAQDVSDCNFCEMPIFGFVGHFEREVHVIQWYNGLGFTEIGDGHCGDKGPTVMCVDCVSSRLQILDCPGHVLQTLPDTTEISEDAVVDDLLSAESGSKMMRYQLLRWCSMCFSIAMFGCACVQDSLYGGEEQKISGCGLRFCHRCEFAFREKHGGNLDQMVQDMDGQSKTSELGQNVDLKGKARADVGFLERCGLLMKHVEDWTTSDDE